MDEKKNTRGGKREGAGHPKGTGHTIKTEKEKVKKHTIAVTDREWEIFLKNGGTKTLRKLINQGLFKEP